MVIRWVFKASYERACLLTQIRKGNVWQLKPYKVRKICVNLLYNFNTNVSVIAEDIMES